MTMLRTLVCAIAAATLLTAAACNTTDTGAQGLVLFTPDKCGPLVGCNFSDGLAVGGTTEVFITGANGLSTAGFDLVSDDDGVFTVAPAASAGPAPRWQLTGTGEGVARLIAVDRDDIEVDFLEVFVQEIDGLELSAFLGDAVGPTSDADFDEIWIVNADVANAFFVRPTLAGSPIMGQLLLAVELDAGLASGLREAAEPTAGIVDFVVPVGTYGATFTSDNNTSIDVLFDAR